jgi:hypothetical protein
LEFRYNRIIKKNIIGNRCLWSRAANFAIQKQILYFFRSSLIPRITGWVPKTFARNAKIVAVDIDKELSKQRGLK